MLISEIAWDVVTNFTHRPTGQNPSQFSYNLTKDGFKKHCLQMYFFFFLLSPICLMAWRNEKRQRGVMEGDNKNVLGCDKDTESEHSSATPINFTLPENLHSKRCAFSVLSWAGGRIVSSGASLQKGPGFHFQPRRVFFFDSIAKSLFFVQLWRPASLGVCNFKFPTSVLTTDQLSDGLSLLSCPLRISHLPSGCRCEWKSFPALLIDLFFSNVPQKYPLCYHSTTPVLYRSYAETTALLGVHEGLRVRQLYWPLFID